MIEEQIERKRLADQQGENLAASVLHRAFNGAALIGGSFQIEDQIAGLRKRETVCWDMSEVFLHARDAHGLHDMGVEIQGIQWAIRELEKAKAKIDV